MGAKSSTKMSPLQFSRDANAIQEKNFRRKSDKRYEKAKLKQSTFFKHQKSFNMIKNSSQLSEMYDKSFEKSLDESSSVKEVIVPYSWEQPHVLENRIIQIHRRCLQKSQNNPGVDSERCLTVVNPILYPLSDSIRSRKLLYRRSSTSLSSLATVSTMQSTVLKESLHLSERNCDEILRCEQSTLQSSRLGRMVFEHHANDNELDNWGYFVDVIPEEKVQRRKTSYRRFLQREIESAQKNFAISY